MKKSILSLVFLSLSAAASAQAGGDLNPFPMYEGVHAVNEPSCETYHYGKTAEISKVKCLATKVEVHSEGAKVCILESGPSWRNENCFTDYWKDQQNNGMFMAGNSAENISHSAGYVETRRLSANVLLNRSYAIFHNSIDGKVYFTFRERKDIGPHSETSIVTVRSYKLTWSHNE